jgi:hypothetical protein
MPGWALAEHDIFHLPHLEGHLFGVWSNSVVRGTEFLRFGLTIRYIYMKNSALFVTNSVVFITNSVVFWEAPVLLLWLERGIRCPQRGIKPTYHIMLWLYPQYPTIKYRIPVLFMYSSPIKLSDSVVISKAACGCNQRSIDNNHRSRRNFCTNRRLKPHNQTMQTTGAFKYYEELGKILSEPYVTHQQTVILEANNRHSILRIPINNGTVPYYFHTRKYCNTIDL